MLHTIENEQLICTIESVGAEIRSLKDKTTGKEYIWQINKSIWESSSPILFPAIGKIKDDKHIYMGNEYAMPRHGIIRNNNKLNFEQNNISSCSFSLASSEETLTQYPFKFLFSVEYTLIKKRLIMNYKVENRDSAPMHFACGGHTAYALPVNEKTKLSDYIIEFPSQINLKTITIADSGLLSNKTRDIISNNKLLPLSNTLFNQGALVFANIKCNWIRLRNKDEKKGIIVRFTDYPHLALWSKPMADYLCIEPWLGLPDSDNESIDITQKQTFKTIDSNSLFSISIETEIE